MKGLDEMKSWKKTRQTRKKFLKKAGRGTRRPRRMKIKNLPVGQKKRRERKIIKRKKVRTGGGYEKN